MALASGEAAQTHWNLQTSFLCQGMARLGRHRVCCFIDPIGSAWKEMGPCKGTFHWISHSISVSHLKTSHPTRDTCPRARSISKQDPLLHVIYIRHSRWAIASLPPPPYRVHGFSDISHSYVYTRVAILCLYIANHPVHNTITCHTICL